MGPTSQSMASWFQMVRALALRDLLKNQARARRPQTSPRLADTSLTPDIFETLRGLGAGSGGEIQLADAINIHARRGDVETVRLEGLRFDCGSVDGFMRASQHEYQRRQSH